MGNIHHSVANWTESQRELQNNNKLVATGGAVVYRLSSARYCRRLWLEGWFEENKMLMPEFVTCVNLNFFYWFHNLNPRFVFVAMTTPGFGKPAAGTLLGVGSKGREE